MLSQLFSLISTYIDEEGMLTKTGFVFKALSPLNAIPSAEKALCADLYSCIQLIIPNEVINSSLDFRIIFAYVSLQGDLHINYKVDLNPIILNDYSSFSETLKPFFAKLHEDLKIWIPL